MAASSLDAIIRRHLSGQLDLGDLIGNGSRRLFRVPNDHLAPELAEGDWATVDLDDRTPSPPGLFLFWDDGRGFVLQRVHVDMNSRKALRLAIWDSRPGSMISVAPGDVSIEGRVTGAWKPA